MLMVLSKIAYGHDNLRLNYNLLIAESLIYARMLGFE